MEMPAAFTVATEHEEMEHLASHAEHQNHGLFGHILGNVKEITEDAMDPKKLADLTRLLRLGTKIALMMQWAALALTLVSAGFHLYGYYHLKKAEGLVEAVRRQQDRQDEERG